MIDTLGIVALAGGTVSVAAIVTGYRAVKAAAASSSTITVSVLSVKWAPPTPQQKKAAAERPVIIGVRDEEAS